MKPPLHLIIATLGLAVQMLTHRPSSHRLALSRTWLLVFLTVLPAVRGQQEMQLEVSPDMLSGSLDFFSAPPGLTFATPLPYGVANNLDDYGWIWQDGSYLTITFPSPVAMSRIRAYCVYNGGERGAQWVAEHSSDNASWVPVADFPYSECFGCGVDDAGFPVSGTGGWYGFSFNEQGETDWFWRIRQTGILQSHAPRSGEMEFYEVIQPPTNAPPSVIMEPVGGDYYVGERAKLSARAQGTLPLRYQWWRGPLCVPAGTNATLALTNLTLDLAGNYCVVITNSFGAVTSQVARITVTLRQAVPVPSGLVAWWTGDGETRDLCGTNHGTLMNGATFTEGQVGQAFQFDGVDDQLVATTAGFPFGNSDRSLEFWFRPYSDSSGGGDWMAGYGPSIDFDQFTRTYGLFWMRNTLVWSQCGDAIFPGVSASVNEWHHAAVTSAGAFTRLYLDGVEIGSGSFTLDTAEAATFYVGKVVDYRGQPRRFYGVIDEVSLYSRALSAAEIFRIYNAGSAGKIKLTPLFLNPPVADAHTLRLSWNGGAGIKLQRTPTLTNPDWRDVAGSEGVSQLEVPRTDTAAFLRLVKP